MKVAYAAKIWMDYHRSQSKKKHLAMLRDGNHAVQPGTWKP